MAELIINLIVNLIKLMKLENKKIFKIDLSILTTPHFESQAIVT